MDTVNWWDNKNNFSILVENGAAILDHYADPNIRIVSLGQSPAWFVKSAEKLAKKRNVKRKFDYIAYSNEHSQYRTDDMQSSDRTYTRGTRPKYENEIQRYRTYLCQKGFDPLSLIEYYKKTGQPTVLLEYVHSGDSLATFLAILFSWANQLGVANDLQKSLIVHTYAGPLETITLPELDIEIKCETKPTINNSPKIDFGSTESTKDRDRIVPKYPPPDWCNPPPSPEGDAKVLFRIRQQLDKTVKEYEMSRIADRGTPVNTNVSNPGLKF